MNKAERIFQLAQENADFYHMYKLRRAGAATPFVNEVVNHLKSRVAQEFGTEVINQFLSHQHGQSVDFWLEDEQAIMELEFDILSSPPVLEKQIFRALLAKDAGNDVKRLILIGDPGAALLLQAPTPKAVIDWVKRHYQIGVEIWELKDVDKADGTPS
jgi:hypothetical protein